MNPSRAELALGTVQFGLAYGVAGRGEPVPEVEVRAILERCAEAGIRRLDTAAAYGDIEERLGRLCQGLDFDVISKVAARPAGLDIPQACDFVTDSIERSARRLPNVLRGVLFHRSDDLLEDSGSALWDAASRACDRLGLALGVSCYGPDSFAALQDHYPAAIVQLPGNVLDQRISAFADAMSQVEVTLRSVFLQGLLMMPASQAAARVPAAATPLTAWRDWCEARGLDPLTGALSIAKALPNVRYCVVGVDDLSQLDQIVAAWTAAQPLTAPQLGISDSAVIDPRYWKTAA